jgi:hypothetical protein
MILEKETDDTNKLTLLAFKIIANLHNTMLATYSPIWRLQVPYQGSIVDFFLFPHLKSIMKGACFADVAVIQEHVTAVLRSIPKEALADSFQKLYERC